MWLSEGKVDGKQLQIVACGSGTGRVALEECKVRGLERVLGGKEKKPGLSRVFCCVFMQVFLPDSLAIRVELVRMGQAHFFEQLDERGPGDGVGAMVVFTAARQSTP